MDTTTSLATRHPRTGDSLLAARLKREVEGDVLFDAHSRGLYATDASIYQIEPIGVVVPRTERAALTALGIAFDEGIPVLPRGGATSQGGQTVGAALIIDVSKHINRMLEFDAEAKTVWVEPGIVLDQLNAQLKRHGLWFPVDISTSPMATIGGMAGNNCCGSRSIRYGNMVHNVRAIDAVLADGSHVEFGEVPADLSGFQAPARYLELIRKVRELAAREAGEIAERVPKIMRHVAGYNLDMVGKAAHNMAHLLVGSEGTLAYFRRLKLDLAPLPRHKTLGVCHFPTFYQAMDMTRHIVTLKPVAVELVDRTMIDLARGNPAFKSTVDRFLKGAPEAILLVEFAGDDRDEQVAKLKQLVELMGDLGLPDSVVEIVDPALQRDTWEVRKAGLSIMMSMKGDGKPVSFIEDCTVPLEHLADYTDRLTRVFEKHGTKGTFYAHASVGCLHVRPILNMREDGAGKMRAIAEEAAAMVREYKGAYSGEHGDGLVRTEWIEPMYGPRLVRAFEEIKDAFDPRGLFNPGKIVYSAAKMDDRTLFRYKPDYKIEHITTALDWAEWGGFDKAVEMCNNNGFCRKFDAGTMCPSYRATGDERHLTRGRANALRLAISGQLGPDALTSDELYETMDLCVSCKGCRRECPTGVDVAKMKIEFLHHYRKRHGLRLKDWLVGYLPRYAGVATRLRWLLNLRDVIPGAAKLTEKVLGFSARRPMPQWRKPFMNGAARDLGGGHINGEVVLLVDCFNNNFEPENARAAVAVLRAAGYLVHLPHAEDGDRPLCCGRTFLSAGLVDQAKAEARRTLKALLPFAARGVPVIGLEPSCLLTLRDEFISLLPESDTGPLAMNALLFEEFLAREAAAGRLKLNLQPLAQKKALLHGHCHQKAFGAMSAVQQALKLIPGLEVEVIESSCCGMAGSFGFEPAHYDISMKMAEASLLPKVRSADSATLIVADGTSCRQQIHDGARREALHVARVLEQALA